MRILTTLLLIISFSFQLLAQETFPKEEFELRREKLFEKIGNGIGIVWGKIPESAPIKFRQSPDLYYLTGLEDPNAILLLVGKTKRVYFFSKKIDQNDVRVDGKTAWQINNIKEEYGIDRLVTYDRFWSLLSYFGSQTTEIYIPLTSNDNVQESRGETNYKELELLEHPIRITPYWKDAVNYIREIFPHFEFQNINPLLDELRTIKTSYEIEQLKISGKIGAEGVLEAIKGTNPGMFEYELEAIATYFYTKRGARGNAFAPIVASGTNTYIIHYRKNNKKIQKEDFVLMDSGCDYNYYTSDVTRVWPASGKFSPYEEKMYLCILEARNTIISSLKPGVTLNQLKAISKEVYNKHGYENPELSWNNYIGHYVGISVHDVGPYDNDTPLLSGMVFNVEPILDDPELKIHMRLEDTILITENGAINLTASVPAELDEIYELMK